MDITRHWRLKMNRSCLWATRCPVTGGVVLPNQRGMTHWSNAQVYEFKAVVSAPTYIVQGLAEAAD
jgi:hypothetical protein